MIARLCAPKINCRRIPSQGRRNSRVIPVMAPASSHPPPLSRVMRCSDYGMDVADDWRNFPNRDSAIDSADNSAESRARFSPPTMTTTTTTMPPRRRRVSLNAAIYHPFFPPGVSHARLNLTPSGIKDSRMRASTCCFRPCGRRSLKSSLAKRVGTVSSVPF